MSAWNRAPPDCGKSCSPSRCSPACGRATATGCYGGGMGGELPLLLSLPLLAVFIALPAMAAWRRRRASREASDIASRLSAWAAALQREARVLPLDETLRLRLMRLRLED